MDSLADMNARLRRIFRGEEQYGEGHPAEQARRFRLAELLPATIEHARRNSAKVHRPPVDLLVSLSGFSPETTILAFTLVGAKRLMVVGSDSTRASVDVIHEKLGLPISLIDTRYVDPVDPMKIYQVIREAAASSGGVRPHVIIDITGGKKVMSASAALAAAQLDLPLCYIDSRFDPELRQSEPGSERLVIVPNPTELFGDRETAAALVAFRHGAYGAARTRFEEVANSAFEPARARFMRDLSIVYQAWCDLDFNALRASVPVLRARLTDPGHRVAHDVAQRLNAQLDLLDVLANAPDKQRDIPPLLLNFYLLGLHYARLGRHDFAALLFYRTVESAVAQRLAIVGPGFRTGKPDYRLLHDDPEVLLARLKSLTADVHGQATTELPFEVGVMNGILLLCALDDRMVKRLGFTTTKALRRVKNELLARNHSVLAHGTETVSEDVREALQSLALRCLRAFWSLAFPGENVDKRLALLEFVVDV